MVRIPFVRAQRAITSTSYTRTHTQGCANLPGLCKSDRAAAFGDGESVNDVSFAKDDYESSRL